MTSPQKKFRLAADEIEDLANGYGACIASDYITVEGFAVAFMYREAADNEVDSGWRFLSGQETDEYMDNADNHGVYDVNTIANYDPDIVPLLLSPIGSAFERTDGNGPLKQIFDFDLPTE